MKEVRQSPKPKRAKRGDEEMKYAIKETGSTVGMRIFNVYINNRFTGAYLNKENALLKIKNSQENYINCEKENEVKNVMFHSSNNSHNSII